MSSLASTPGKRLVILRTAATGVLAAVIADVSCWVISSRSRAALRIAPRRGPDQLASQTRVLLRRVGDRGHQGADLRRVPHRLDLHASVDDLLAHRLELGPDVVWDVLGVEQMHGI